MRLLKLAAVFGVVAYSATTLAGTASSEATSKVLSEFDYALNSAQPLITNYHEHFQTYGLPPNNLAELGMSEAVSQNQYLEHVDIEPVSHAVMLGMDPGFGQNEWTALIPNIEGYHLNSWICQSTLPASQVQSSGCKGDVPFELLTTPLPSDLFQTTLGYANEAKVGMSEYHQSNGEFPRALTSVGIDQNWLDSAYVDHAIVEPTTHTLLLGLAEVYGDNHWLSLTPVVFWGSVYWSCKTTLPYSMVNTPACNADVAIENLLP